jgi:hypothetical protein
MAVSTGDVRGGSQQLAGALLGDVERIAGRTAARLRWGDIRRT